ncbi:pentapeptide repeat-containing protein [Lentilactobacillus sp. Marseille-Q4993]|uniref:pentapeptide repeat-containing protein n=1 Tax=Lentilactobacillus sp. Marseille-Q4993 TaxID=3039492 RepID=UPI0024BBF607|nr:pentapeptide repeat-containing protein [Lentilactobacillus sp. Marseille-Q4993]
MIEDKTLAFDDIEEGNEYKNCQFSPSNGNRMVSDVVFVHCLFDQDDFDGKDWNDVKFIGCSLPNKSFHQNYFANCEFSGCQLTGSDFSIGTKFLKTKFTSSKLMYANFSETAMEQSGFENCELIESSFQAVKVKKGLAFTGCDVDGIDFLDTNLKGIDLSTATFGTLVVDPTRLKGLKINPYQASVLITMFGVEIK